MSIKEKVRLFVEGDAFHRKMNFINQTKTDIENCTSLDNVHALLDSIEQDNKYLFSSLFMSRETGLYYILALVSLALGYLFFEYEHTVLWLLETVMGSFAITFRYVLLCLCGALVLVGYNGGKDSNESKKRKINAGVQSISRKLYTKTLSIRHALAKNVVNKGAFLDFNRCNYSNYADDSFKMETSVGSKVVNCTLIRTSHTQEIKETKGFGKNKQTIVKYKTGYRWGIILPSFSDVNSVIISQTLSHSVSQPKRNQYATFKPASISFEKTFYSQGIDQISVAQFLTPKTMLFIEDLSKTFKNLTFEVNGSNQLLIHQSTYSLLEEISSNVRNIGAFRTELIEKTQLEDFFTLIKKLDPLY